MPDCDHRSSPAIQDRPAAAGEQPAVRASSPADPGGGSAPWRQLPGPALRAWQIDTVIGLVVFAALLTVLALVGRPGFLQPWLLPLAVAAVASAAVEVAVVLPRRHRRYRYRIVEGSVIVETGVTFFRQLVVPARHVLFVEINRGPVLRALGLAKVQLGTIADAKSVGPLTQATAEELRGEIETAAGVR